MIKLPNRKNSFGYENDFYLSCQNSRIGKLIIHYELFKMINGLPGDIVECGIFKGMSLIRFATFRNLFKMQNKKKILGFDAFGKFPEAKFEQDKKLRKKFIKDSGNSGISKFQLLKILKNKKLDKKVELVKGNITKTIPQYVKQNPNLQIALLNLDTDIYEPSITILNHLYPKIVKGGILILDDYGSFPGETKAVDEFFNGKEVDIKQFSFQKTPKYIIKK